jgi:nickel/cobalt transporter (NicO) family protein
LNSIKSSRWHRLVLLALGLLLFYQPPLGAQSPFRSGSAKPVDPPKKGILAPILERSSQIQSKLRNEMSALVRQMKEDKRLWLGVLLFLFSFLYGLLHALGPGHGKTILMSYMLAEERPSVLKGIAAGTIVAFGEALSAILIVYGIYYLSLGRIGTLFDLTTARIQVLGYSIILATGILLLAFRLKKHLFRRCRKAPERSVATPASTRWNFLVVISLGIIPCPGVMLLLVFMLTLQMPLLGLVLALTMALGMAITISLAGVAVAVSKAGLITAISRKQSRLRNIEALLELGGALLIIGLALVLLV